MVNLYETTRSPGVRESSQTVFDSADSVLGAIATCSREGQSKAAVSIGEAETFPHQLDA